MTLSFNKTSEDASESLTILDKEPEIKKFLKNYEDEDYVWIAEELMFDLGFSENDIRANIFGLRSLNNVKDYALSTLKNSRNLTLTLDNLSKSPQRFSSTHLKAIKDSPEKILTSLNLLSSKLPPDFFFSIKNNHIVDVYFLLLFILHFEIHFEDIPYAIRQIATLPKKIDEISHIQVNLNKYIQDENFIEWCYTHLQRNQYRVSTKEKGIIKQTFYISNTPENIEEKKTYIKTYLNLFYIESDQEKLKYKVTLENIKKAWRAKCYREKSKNNKTYHLPITLQARGQLKELATFKNMTDGELLSKLIGDAFLKEMCDENGKKIY